MVFLQSLLFSYSFQLGSLFSLWFWSFSLIFFMVFVSFCSFVFLFLLYFSFATLLISLELFFVFIMLDSFFLFHHVWFLFLLSFFDLFHFTRDVRQPLSQIRLSLSVSLGVGQLIFLVGVNATEHTVRGFSDLFIQLIKSCCSTYF